MLLHRTYDSVATSVLHMSVTEVSYLYVRLLAKAEGSSLTVNSLDQATVSKAVQITGLFYRRRCICIERSVEAQIKGLIF